MFSQGSIKEALSRFFRLDTLTENLSGYVEARVELLKLEVKEDVAKAITRAMVYGIIAFFAFLFIIFLSIGLAIFINQAFKEKYIGFSLVGGFYLILFVISLVFRKAMVSSVEQRLKNRLNNTD